MQFLSVNKHTGIKWEKLHTSHLGILKAEFGLRQDLITQQGGFSPSPTRKASRLHSLQTVKHAGYFQRGFCWAAVRWGLKQVPRRGTQKNWRMWRSGEVWEKSPADEGEKKNVSLFNLAQTPTCLTQLQWLKGRISLLFLTLHPSSLALSSAEAINQACTPSLSLSL